MTGRGKKAGAPKKKANGYKMPVPIPIGEVINDPIGKKKWRIGPSIGVGGFGEIYSACDHEGSPKKTSSYPFVIKIEPHENGPLFVEKHFYVRNANKDDILNYMKSKKLASLGMPLYYGSGSHNFKGERYRFLVLERYGKDVWKIFTEAGRVFPMPVVFQLGLQMLDVLEYIHSKGYVHADIKGANILMGSKKGTENQAYLVDFGLASRVADKELKPDPKCAHNGTIEYTSRDAHSGVATMRGDLEILGYNLLQWATGALPWEGSLASPPAVRQAKDDLMRDVRAAITRDYPDVPDALIKFFEYINTLKPKEHPDYTKCRQMFETYLKSVGKTRTSKLDFTLAKKGKTKRVVGNDESDDDKPLKQNKDAPKAKRTRKPKDKPSDSDNENELPNDTNEKITKNKKRKSLEPSVVVKVKKTKLAPKATPPVKKNHANIATQTSVEKRRSPRQVSFDSPICAIIGETKPSKNGLDSVNSSGDIFEDSFVIEDKKVKPKRKLLSKEEIVEKRVVKKKVTAVKKGKSWKDTTTIVNGRSPPQ